MTEISRQIASDAAVIAIALIAASFVLIGVNWKPFKMTFYKYGFERRRELGKVLLVFLIPVIFLYSVMTYVGSMWPDLLQPSGILAMILIIISIITYIIIKFIKYKINKNRKRDPKSKINGELLTSSLTLAITAIGILCDALALFGVIDVALSIKLPNKSTNDFNLSKWLLLDGTGFFIIGIIGSAFSIVPRKKQSDEKSGDAK